ncbi:NAD(P)/FAD-dependent oxidoreductase [Paraburkholderia caballeronis]|uniref:Glycine/D-amino acid oxidase n=1 Tax=Paraburkholderia caballeronis TaxID=416943 RepID=A0A1H7UI00_9BURK|nr:FAD-binding oxidoreductase [Paraburkholderia caballeronis]PXW17509.1 glycine/D-amino acid oxidase-like deaminating enzyme [Paraburkholderia caballeronis]PXW95098.1 glycine/D-amino acid oxidase-like deaminating enzyme [Paraburkholderia caballeronis]RAJ90944.1 glycine/D-amino acid oxidase-like deaminating enzyme [Paraburkholderia caballeronis]SEE18521.1 Glycine/D-amino acid oxidase [Paraburkholderia caballeronis]SEL96439.1 Glycine/D-amino acid oxidase [Paraburkholderia caballeronis]
MMTTYPLHANFASTDDPFPVEADVVIAGAGIMGCAAAYYLAKRGVRAVVLDKSRIAGQQSTRAWGFVRQQGRETAEVPLMMAGMRIWEGLETELNFDLEWRQGGCLYVADNDADWASFTQWLDVAKQHGLDTRALDRAQVDAIAPGLVGRVVGGLYTASDGQAEPRRVAAAFAARSREAGARFFEGCGVIGVEREAGAIAGVVTERGSIRTRRLICTAGASSWRLLRELGLTLPQQSVRGTCMRTNALPAVTASTFWGHGLGIRQRANGAINLADDMQVDVDMTLGHLRALKWFMPELWAQRDKFSFHLNGALWRDLRDRLPGVVPAGERVLHPRDPDPRPNPAHAPRALAKLRALFPALRDAQIVEAWAGLIDVLPDGIPVLDAPAGTRGLVIATGFCGHGFAMGPIVGRLIAEWLDDGVPSLDVSAFRLQRFFDGTMQRPRSML